MTIETNGKGEKPEEWRAQGLAPKHKMAGNAWK